MGYGAGHEVKLNGQDGYALYTGKSLKISLDDAGFTSWDFTHPMDGMTDIRLDLLKISIPPIILNAEDRKNMKEAGFTRGEKIYFTWYKNPEGLLWSGYVRSPLNVAFPIELKGDIDFSGYLGTWQVTAIVKPVSNKKFQEFIEDVCDYCVDEESAEEYAREEGMTEDRAREVLYDLMNDDNRMNYGANQK